MRTSKPFFATIAILLLSAVSASGLVEMKNQYLKVIGDPDSGRYIIKTTGGDPELTTDKNKLLLYEEYPPTSFATIRIDGLDYQFGGEKGNFTLPFTLQNNAMACTWSVNDIDVTCMLEFVSGPNTGRLDSVKISYMAVNKDSRPHNIGIRILLDTYLGNNDGSPFRIPGVGEISTETMFKGDRVPDYWYAYDELGNPSVRAQGTLKYEGLTPPNMIVFASWARFSKSYWDFDIIDGRSFRRNVVGPPDSATADYWNPVSVEPNGRFGVSTLYGLYGATIIKGEAFNVSLGGPISTKGEPVTITADIQKSVLLPASNVRAVFNLPEGLTMYNGDTAEKKIGSIVSNAKVAKVKWDIVPDGKAKGICEYGIAISGVIEGKEYRTVVKRKLEIMMEVRKPADLPTPKTNKPPPPLQKIEPKFTVSTRYYFDFGKIDSVLAEINKDLESNSALIETINALLSAKPRIYDPGQKGEHQQATEGIDGKFPTYTSRINEAGKNVINVKNVTNKAQ